MNEDRVGRIKIYLCLHFTPTDRKGKCMSKIDMFDKFLLSLLLFTFLKEIYTIFTIYNALTNLLKQIYVRFLTNYVRFVSLLL